MPFFHKALQSVNLKGAKYTDDGRQFHLLPVISVRGRCESQPSKWYFGW
jgi:hypothetical protein